MKETDQTSARYALSFTSGGLLVREAELFTALYLRVKDWKAVRRTVIEQNLLQSRTSSSSLRITRETLQRLAVLSEPELELLVEASLTERGYLMWIAACRRYDLIGDFAEEVLRERFLLMTPTLGIEEFDRFVTGKSLWHPELDDLKISTRAKLRQNVFRMLYEAGLHNKQGDIVPAVLSGRVFDLFQARTPSDVRFLPTNLPTEVDLR
ncbi:hypothetical protein CGQ24_13880 [Arthrobacter sp. 7749]|nr:hypothetical protein CGQ24_13880 [Arthrobacter sp. 7749]